VLVKSGVSDHFSSLGIHFSIPAYLIGSQRPYTPFFYPLVFFAVIRGFTQRIKIKALELLDMTIITFGLTSVLTAFLLKPAMIGFAGSAFTFLSQYFIELAI
jgi:hypothetical protein